MKVFRHKKTGKLYELVQDRILFKDVVDIYIDMGEDYIKYDWRGKKDSKEQLVLYKALYDNPDGPSFVRHKEDFEYEFEEVTDQNTTGTDCMKPIEGLNSYFGQNGDFNIVLSSKNCPTVHIRAVDDSYYVNDTRINHELYMTIWEIVYDSGVISVKIDEILELVEKHDSQRKQIVKKHMNDIVKLCSELGKELDCLGI